MTENKHSNREEATAEMMRFITAKWISKPIYVAARLGIADLLAGGPLPVADLALRCQCHAPSLYRVLRALAAVGIFSESVGQSFAQTPLSACLRTGALRAAALSFVAPWNDRAWMFLLEGVKNGAVPFELDRGRRFANWLQTNPRAEAALQEANAFKAAVSHRAVLDVYDFSGLHLLVDVGGGTGALAVEILASRPALQGIVADLPSVLSQAERTIARSGLQDRCRAVACDFFDCVPPGADIYLLSDILHDWPDSRCREILATCRRAVSGRARLLIVEMVVPPGTGFSVAKLLDLEMLVLCGGRQRTAAEHEALLEASGFALKRILPTPEGVTVLEALPA